MVVQITSPEELKSNLDQAGNNLVVIDFFATWCGPCKMIAPKYEELAAELSNVVFLKVDIDELGDIAAEYNITSMPTFVFIKQGKVLESFSGANFIKLKEIVNKHM